VKEVLTIPPDQDHDHIEIENEEERKEPTYVKDKKSFSDSETSDLINKIG